MALGDACQLAPNHNLTLRMITDDHHHPDRRTPGQLRLRTPRLEERIFHLLAFLEHFIQYNQDRAVLQTNWVNESKMHVADHGGAGSVSVKREESTDAKLLFSHTIVSSYFS